MIKLIEVLTEVAIVTILILDIIKDIKEGADTDQSDNPDKDE